MKLIDKYLIKLLTAPVFYCLSGFMLIMVISEIFGDMDRILDAKPPWYVILRFYISILAPYLKFLIPAALMLGTLYTLYGLTRNSELVAMRASGISIYRLVRPILAVGLVFALISGLLNEIWVPHAHEWVEQMKETRFASQQQDAYRQCIYLNPSANRQWNIDRFNPQNPQRLFGVEIKQETDNGFREFVIQAPRVEYLDGQWWFFSATVQRFGETDNPIGQPVPLGASTNSVVEMRAFNEQPTVFVSATRQWQYLNGREMLHYIRTHPELTGRALSERLYSLHSHLAMPLAPLIVILFAIPAGSRTARQGVLSAVFTAIAMMAGFYTLAQIGLVLGSTGSIPPWLGAWLSNLVFGAIGLFQLFHLR